jgi:hypothetical protein
MNIVIDKALEKLIREVYINAVKIAAESIVVEAKQDPVSQTLTLTGHLREGS